ncbi:MAG: ABC transporter permease, partial [Acidobacteriota bacterium]
FILVFQLPNLLTRPGLREKQQAEREVAQKFAELKKEYDDGQISPEEYERQLDAIQKGRKSDDESESERVSEIVRIVNMVAPPGWLPYGVTAAAEGRYFPVLACIFGMGLIGTASLRRSYRTTIRLYTGDFTKGRASRKIKTETVFKDASDTKTRSGPSSAFLEKRLPRMSEHASAITLMNFRSLIRAPEVKMLLLTPVILVIVFGGMFASKENEISGLARPLIAMGFTAFILIIGMTGYLGNQFAFDRGGFRTFVLSCAPRRDILLGKNLSLLPFAIVLMILFIGVCRWLNPMRWDYLAAVLIQTLPMYLLFCITGNVLSILSPMTLRPGSGMPASHQGMGTLFHIVFMLVVPVPMSFTLVPLGVEALYASFSSDAWFPVFMVLSLIEVPVVIWLYRTVINWQGTLLQQNEQKMLDVVSAKGE